MIAPDEKTFLYLKNREFAPKNQEWDIAVEHWKELYSEKDAQFDLEFEFKGEDIQPMITYGTNPGMGMDINKAIPENTNVKALNYMGFDSSEKLIGKKIDYVFLGSCTNGRLEDFQAFARVVHGRKKSPDVTAWLVPGSHQVIKQLEVTGVKKILTDAGFEIREPGCSACLAMNEDKIPNGKYAVSTSNRNFEGRQGPGSRTLLASPYVAAAAAINGAITDPRKYLN